MISSTHLHAMVVHFPIALLMVAFLFEMISFFYKKEFFHKSSIYLLVLGMLGTVVSYLFGNAAGEGIEEGALGKVIELHEQSATISLWLTISTTFTYLTAEFVRNKRSWIKLVNILLFAVVISSIARTGYLGGQLVYKHGAGVQLAIPDFSSPDEK